MPLLQSLWSPRRRLTLAFSPAVSYQSASLTLEARREPMGLAFGDRAAAVALTASTADAQRRRRRAIVTQSGPTYGAHVGLQFRCKQSAHRRTALLAVHAGPRALSDVRHYFISGGSLWALNFDLSTGRPPLRRVVRRRRTEWSHSSSAGVSDKRLSISLCCTRTTRCGRGRIDHLQSRASFIYRSEQSRSQRRAGQLALG